MPKLFVLILLFTAYFTCVTSALAETHTVYIGTYTNNGKSKGIYHAEFDSQSGKLTLKGLAAKTTDPSFLAMHPDGKHVYAVNETQSGELSSFKINSKTKELELINQKPSGGAHPCHLVVDATGTNLLAANYSGGSISVTKINKDGGLGRQSAFIQHEGSSVTDRQKSAHAHSINVDAGNKFAVAADLGMDQLLVYSLNAKSGNLKKRSVISMKPGAGPRHFVFHPNGTHAYAINELLSTVAVLTYDAKKGKLEELQTISTLPLDYTKKGNSTAEVRISPDGKFVYGSNRGHDSIAVFRVNKDFTLTTMQIQKMGGKTPRNFNLDPSGKFLLAAGQSSNDIHVFAIDPKLGKLTKTEHSIEVPSPVCIRFALDGR